MISSFFNLYFCHLSNKNQIKPKGRITVGVGASWRPRLGTASKPFPALLLSLNAASLGGFLFFRVER